VNPVRKAFNNRLVGDSDLMEMLPNGEDDVYYRRPVDAGSGPYIVFGPMSPGVDDWTFTDSMQWRVWMIKAVHYADSPTDAEDIAAAINDLFNDVDLEIENTRSLVCRRVSEIDYPETRGEDTVHHVGGQYRLLTQSTG